MWKNVKKILKPLLDEGEKFRLYGRTYVPSALYRKMPDQGEVLCGGAVCGAFDKSGYLDENYDFIELTLSTQAVSNFVVDDGECVSKLYFVCRFNDKFLGITHIELVKEEDYNNEDGFVILEDIDRIYEYKPIDVNPEFVERVDYGSYIYTETERGNDYYVAGTYSKTEDGKVIPRLNRTGKKVLRKAEGFLYVAAVKNGEDGGLMQFREDRRSIQALLGIKTEKHLLKEREYLDYSESREI